VHAIERTREYGGLYHVLHGAISPATSRERPQPCTLPDC
jgi:recombinational DNA repair protein RecR